MAVPKQRTSKARRDKRRSHHALTSRSLGNCPECGSPKLPHRVCPSCGQYKARPVIEVQED